MREVQQTKIIYGDKEILLPFDIGTFSIVETKDELLFFPLSSSVEREGSQVLREVYSAKYTYIHGQFDVDYGTITKRMSMPRDMETNSKVIHQKPDK